MSRPPNNHHPMSVNLIQPDSTGHPFAKTPVEMPGYTGNRIRVSHFATIAFFYHSNAGAMDIIFISELRVETIIGIFDWERTKKQLVSIDIEMAADITSAANTDDIADTLSYKDVSKRVEQFTADSQFQLVETLAERLSEVIRNEFNVPWVRLTMHKPGALSNSKDVGVIIERGVKK